MLAVSAGPTIDCRHHGVKCLISLAVVPAYITYDSTHAPKPTGTVRLLM